MLIDTYRTEIQKKKIPYLVLILDEHSGQAGLETRLEAFIDSTGW
jgi:predicted nucleotide-binding protein (sugar kinase/HSP70/actin superfamily)